MASTFSTGAVAANVQARSGIGLQAVASSFTVTGGAALVLNDVIQMVKVPVGATIVEVILTSTDLDTSTGIKLDVGDGNDTDRFIKQSLVGQTGGVERMGFGVLDATHLNYQYSVEDTIDVKVQTAATGTAATTFTIGLVVIYNMQQTVV